MGPALSVLVDPGALVAAPLRPPRSKSDAQRALVLAHALGLPAPSLGEIEDQPRDTRIVAAALARFAETGGIDLHCHDGGAPFRFLVAQAAVRRAETRLTGSARLAARPHAALLDALRQGLPGLALERGDPWPLVVRGVTPPAELSFSVDARESSQPLSSLLLLGAAHVARGGARATVEATGAIASEGYLEMTCSWLRRAGVRCERQGARFTIDAVAAGRLPAVPADWSSAGYLLLVAWASGGWIEGVDAHDEHPDRSIVEHLGELGLAVEWAAGRLTVRGTPQRGLDVAIDRAPDSAPTLAALACVLPAPSRLRAIGVLRHKESDRVAAIVAMVQSAGGQAILEDRSLVITPPARRPERLIFDARADHRMAMAAATLAVLLRTSLVLTGHEHVDKSFPQFWRELARAGVRLDKAASNVG